MKRDTSNQVFILVVLVGWTMAGLQLSSGAPLQTSLTTLKFENKASLTATIERLIDENKLPAARKRLREIIDRDGHSGRTLLLEAMILHKEESFLESLKKAQASIELDGTGADAYKLFGLNLVRLGRDDLAGPYFDAATKLAPDDAVAWYYLGLYNLEKKRSKPARRHLERAVALNPDSVDAHCVLGLTYEQEGNYEQAIRIYGQAATVQERLGSGQETPYLYMGRLLIALDRHEESVPPLREAVALNPNQGDAWLELGRALARLSREHEAIEALQRAARLAPQDKRPHYQLMTVYRQQGHLAKARREMEIFRKLEQEEAAESSSEQIR